MATREHISVADFFRSPTRAAATISPDGTRIAYLAPWRNRLNVWVQSVDSDSDSGGRCVTADQNRSVLDYQWTDDPRWLLYTQDGNGDENWHVYRVDLDDPSAPAVDLTPFPGARAYFEMLADRPGTAMVGIINRTPNSPTLTNSTSPPAS
jgi:hypothetical protein